MLQIVQNIDDGSTFITDGQGPIIHEIQSENSDLFLPSVFHFRFPTP